jgi:hypothetical protein
MLGDFELICIVLHVVVQLNVVLKYPWYGNLFENCLPWTLGLTRAAIDALIWVNIELIGKLVAIAASVFINAIDRAYRHATGV